MTAVLVLSDIHGNYAALRTVLDHSPELPIWFLGDALGYYPQHKAVLAELQALKQSGRLTLWIQGNHDVACATNRKLDRMSETAAAAARLTHNALAAEEREYLIHLRPEMTIIDDFVYACHGGPDAPLDHYMWGEEDACQAVNFCPTPVALVGHTHIPCQLVSDNRLARFGGWSLYTLSEQPDTPFRFEVGNRHCSFLNPGSVGQPRDRAGYPNATYAILDLDQKTFQARRVRYDPSALIAETYQWLQGVISDQALLNHTERLLIGI